MLDAIDTPLETTTPYWRDVARARNGFPAGPRFWTPFGMMASFRPDPLGFYQTAFRTFGDVVGFHVGPFSSLLIAHPDHIKHVLQDNNHNYVKGIVIAKLKVLIGEGLFTSEGDFWRRQRQLAQPAFHRQRLGGLRRHHGVGDRGDARALGGAPAERRDRRRGRGDEPADARYRRPHALQPESRRRGRRGRAHAHRGAGAHERPHHALPAIAALVADRVQPPPRAADPTSSTGVVFDIIAARRRTDEAPEDLLDMLLRARDEETGEGMTDRQLRDEVMTFVLAGHETTAVALSWTWYLLDRHPEVAERAAGRGRGGARRPHAHARGPAPAPLRVAWSSRRRCASIRPSGASSARHSRRTRSASTRCRRARSSSSART